MTNSFNVVQGLLYAEPITLKLESKLPVPSKKNAMRIGQGRLFTKKEIRAQIEEITQDFESQLSWLLSGQHGNQIQTTKLPRYLIALFVPLDDSRDWIEQTTIACCELPAGIAAEIIIERIN